GTWAPLQSVNGVSAQRLVDAAVELGRRDWQRLLVAEFCAVAATAGVAAEGDYRIARIDTEDQQAAATARNLVTGIWYFLVGSGVAAAPVAEAAIADFGHLGMPSEQLSPAQ